MKTRGGTVWDEAAMSAPDDTALRNAIPEKKLKIQRRHRSHSRKQTEKSTLMSRTTVTGH